MEIIRGPITLDEEVSRIDLEVDRATLSKRRWRAAAGDGREFGFDLDQPLANGALFFREGGTAYGISQRPEPVLEIPLGDSTSAARLGWMIGNLHFPIELSAGAAFTVDDAAARSLFQRENIAFAGVKRVFQPLTAGAMSHMH